MNIPHYRLEFLNFVNGVPTQVSVDEYGNTVLIYPNRAISIITLYFITIM